MRRDCKVRKGFAPVNPLVGTKCSGQSDSLLSLLEEKKVQPLRWLSWTWHCWEERAVCIKMPVGQPVSSTSAEGSSCGQSEQLGPVKAAVGPQRESMLWLWWRKHTYPGRRHPRGTRQLTGALKAAGGPPSAWGRALEPESLRSALPGNRVFMHASRRGPAMLRFPPSPGSIALCVNTEHREQRHTGGIYSPGSWGHELSRAA